MIAPAPSPQKLSRVTLWAGLLGLVVAGAASLWFVLLAAWSDAGTLSARYAINEWRTGKRPPLYGADWERARDDLQAALATTPGNAALHEELAFIHAARSRSTDDMQQAVLHYRAATALRPTFPYSWTHLALAKHYLGQHDDEFWAAYDHALGLGHSEAALQPAIAEIAFAIWKKLGPQRQQAIGSMVATAKDGSRKPLQDMAQRAGVQLPTP